MNYHTVGLLALIICTCAACSPLADQEPQTPDGNSDVPEYSPRLEMDNPFAPQAGDDAMAVKNAYVDDISWDPDARTVRLTGNLPTPCNQLRISAVIEGSSLVVTVYSVYPADSMCAEVLEPFEAVLTITSMPEGTNQIIINGEAVEI